ncbi:hypothetical protein RRX38_02930 [Pseudomonas sp. DTU_2021_1001937_2_SI_NGA_ILE_001]|uniref:hypothetical protein n=1 Tax=Pseudomonas sp. DTU_2021_1001937_2_SI_NGA_ILE_001 TaxID=3077589 RepID=UPI0028FC142B|nr:hypothetical protein [Pseudomonas sp. DTU_2021_1001937_2_SI_NGA_ILE_001]WNW10144.1 hypothetical protein RRX38_02930 [Pseudomonas sp. DTU_2021_1001937_2_SI_NGA_ILE_001]
MDKHICFTTEMARLIITDRKTVTRRAINHHAAGECPYGPVGVHLWLKEDFYAYGRWEVTQRANQKRLGWHFIDMTLQSGQDYQFTAPGPLLDTPFSEQTPRWWHRPGRLMPRRASRATLEVTDIQTERLHDITDEQAQQEGFYSIHDSAQTYFVNHLEPPYSGLSPTAVIAFATWWEYSDKHQAWHDNPWVWVITFRRL